METRREKGLCLFRAKKSLKRRGTVGSAAANPHNGRIVRNGSTNLRVIYVLITGLQRGRARFAHVPLPLLSASHNGNNGGKTDTRACYRSETLSCRERERELEFSPQSFPFFFLFSLSLRYLHNRNGKVIIMDEREKERDFEIAYLKGKRGKEVRFHKLNLILLRNAIDNW